MHTAPLFDLAPRSMRDTSLEATTMRVFVYPDKTFEELGTERYEVEWQEVPDNWALLDEDQREQYGYDQFRFCYETFQGPGAQRRARKFAAKQAKHRANAYGSAAVTRQVVEWFVEEDRIAEWADAGEPEYFP